MTTMSEEDRINLMRNVKAGDLSVDQALKRFIRCEINFLTVELIILFHLHVVCFLLTCFILVIFCQFIPSQ